MILCDVVKGGYESDIHLEASYQTIPSYFRHWRSHVNIILSLSNWGRKEDRNPRHISPLHSAQRHKKIYWGGPIPRRPGCKKGRLPEYITVSVGWLS